MTVDTQDRNDDMTDRLQEGVSVLTRDKLEHRSATASFSRTDLLKQVPALRAFARLLARDATLADDLVQETILRALAKAGQFTQGTNLKAWTFSILRNLFLEQARRKQKEKEVLDHYASDAQTQPANRQNGPDRETIRDLDYYLWQLSPLLREALILIGAQEMTYEEAACICEVSVGTMKTRVSRARAELQALTQDH
ncbi:DNA-directed RNA polymerase sigma-E/Sigma-24/FecI [Acetobacter tropicalis NBRC 101654]|uniref:DNA-directed RNA polymerase sigma-E/Sigma-24/FecI n=3 Tax=Acetobacteraceae TaxID=433 RepID=F7VFR8_9PROT|nr:RNA polymerase subunit sigma-70 [Acetobacter tropicalis]GAA09213.1 DNA-directed RNA polymerase sigma-E/Sigma-24/FecI [Acetobacter tropicalis NBRC 101654]